jgi:RNA polymerase-binding transcription factor
MDPARAQELLARERERVETQLNELGRERTSDDVEPGDRDSEDLYQQEFDAGRETDLRDQLAAVERAEARLAEGTYGLSVRTGKPIPDERLEILPTAEANVDEEGGGG